MNTIEILQLRFIAEVAVNSPLHADHVKTIQTAIINAINETSCYKLLVGETRMTIDVPEKKK
jgi:hypothetical protein